MRGSVMGDAPPFRTSFDVRIGDINYGGGVGLIMSEAHLSFKAEVFLGDELSVTVTARELKQIRFALDYEVQRRSDGKVAASG